MITYTGHAIEVPREVVVCPRCGGRIFFHVDEWTADLAPTETGIEWECEYADPFDRSTWCEYDYEDVCNVPRAVWKWASWRVRVDLEASAHGCYLREPTPRPTPSLE